jgi:two-component system sensor histidine kinase ChvG
VWSSRSIAPARRPRTSRRPRGAAFGGNSGLGLSIARQIIEAHGGKIWAQNILNAEGLITGARFTLSLPALTA